MYVRVSVRPCDIMLKRPTKELKRENLSKEASKHAGKRERAQGRAQERELKRNMSLIIQLKIQTTKNLRISGLYLCLANCMDYWFILFKYLQHKYKLLNLKTKNCKTNNRKLFYLLLGKNKHKH